MTRRRVRLLVFAGSAVAGGLLMYGILWLIRHRTGWEASDALFSLILGGWAYWLTWRQQVILVRLDAIDRADERTNTDELPVVEPPQAEVPTVERELNGYVFSFRDQPEESNAQ